MTASETRELRPASGIGTSLVQQAWLLGVSGRWAYMTVSLIIALLLIRLGDVPDELPALLLAWVAALPAGVIWAILVWTRENPDRRSYHWSLPVSRPAHELARVAIGAAYLVAACIVLALAGGIASAADGVFARFAALPAQVWANFFLAPFIVYLLVMPLVLWSDYAIMRGALGGFTGFVILAAFFEPLGRVVHALFMAEPRGLSPTLLNPVLAAISAAGGPAEPPSQGWWSAVALWLAVGLTMTVFTAVFRPDDIRRLVRR